MASTAASGWAENSTHGSTPGGGRWGDVGGVNNDGNWASQPRPRPTVFTEWKDADFEMATRDNQVFKVPTYILQASSWVSPISVLTLPAPCFAT